MILVLSVFLSASSRDVSAEQAPGCRLTNVDVRHDSF